ncbi:MAG: hypothetical protein JWR84_793 [Caulobacter sp.]|nr:hypothetical protein [Caulobacter sp.]
MDNLIQAFADNVRGRGDRREFWIGFALQLVASFALVIAGGMLHFSYVWASFLTLPVWLFYANRRLHDLGVTGWLGLIPFGSGFVLGIVVGLAKPAPEIRALVMTFAPLAVTVATVLWLGCTPGQAEPNRFGAPPGQDNPADTF